mmetsp:Transcript_51568/g.158907  ORF Transcript_51568/g.158907 Transcript_51568/m.158907 type:complete len:238 (+) Transcript_51568:742-1455(+)
MAHAVFEREDPELPVVGFPRQTEQRTDVSVDVADSVRRQRPVVKAEAGVQNVVDGELGQGVFGDDLDEVALHGRRRAVQHLAVALADCVVADKHTVAEEAEADRDGEVPHEASELDRRQVRDVVGELAVRSANRGHHGAFVGAQVFAVRAVAEVARWTRLDAVEAIEVPWLERGVLSQHLDEVAAENVLHWERILQPALEQASERLLGFPDVQQAEGHTCPVAVQQRETWVIEPTKP